MLPYLIAGVIGYGIAKLFEDDKTPKYTDGGLIAPNGKPSNLTPEQYKLVRTKAFKDWFGDWENDPANASKVVDKNGEPKVMWHYSPNQFFVFNPNAESRWTNQRKENVVWFGGTNKVISYSEGEKGFLYECFLNAKNPIIVDAKDYDVSDYYKDENGNKTYSIQRIKGAFVSKLGEVHWSGKKNDNDGIIFKNAWDNVPLGLVVAIINSNQIKLADGTNTTFDSNNSDIRYAGGGEISFNNNRVFFNGEDIGLFEYGINGNEIEINRLYLDNTKQKQGFGRDIIKNLFESYPNVDKIVLYPLPSSEPFWIRITENVTKDGYFEITRNSFEIGNKNYFRFNGGGEARPFTDDGNKLVVFNQYRNYIPYKIAVDDINDAKYITLWKTDINTGIDKKIGYLKLYNTSDGFLSVQEISIDRGNKGLGLGLEMYKIALKYSSDKIKGIKSYLPNRANRKQVPKIYKKLNSVRDGDYEFIYKKNNPDIRFEDGGMVNNIFDYQEDFYEPKKYGEVSYKFKNENEDEFNVSLTNINKKQKSLVLDFEGNYSWETIKNNNPFKTLRTLSSIVKYALKKLYNDGFIINTIIYDATEKKSKIYKLLILKEFPNAKFKINEFGSNEIKLKNNPDIRFMAGGELKRISAGNYIGKYKGVEYQIINIPEQKVWYWKVGNEGGDDWYYYKKIAIEGAKEFIDSNNPDIRFDGGET